MSDQIRDGVVSLAHAVARAGLVIAAGGNIAGRVGADLLARWGEPHRHYHTVTHLAVVLAVVDENASHSADADAVRLAAWTPGEARPRLRRVTDWVTVADLATVGGTLALALATFASIQFRIVRLGPPTGLPGRRSGRCLRPNARCS